MGTEGKQLFTRVSLAERWFCSTRKIDRLRQDGLLPWIDLSGGKGKKPLVRFRTQDIEQFEKQNLKDLSDSKTGTL